MRKIFPILALLIGVALTMLVLAGGIPDDNGSTTLPLLTLLIASEFGFIVTLIGATVSIKQGLAEDFTMANVSIAVCCAALSIYLAWHGINLWPGVGSSP